MDFHLNMAGIQGEDKDTGFVNQVKVENYSLSFANPTSVKGSSGSGSATQVICGDCTCTITFDKAIKALFQAITKGTHIATATLSGVKSGTANKAFITFTFTECFITSLSHGGGGGMDVPSVSMSFSYNKITQEYFTQGTDGTVGSTGPASWESSSKTAS
jgi:type VI secretion system secreted protein Hcp